MRRGVVSAGDARCAIGAWAMLSGLLGACGASPSAAAFEEETVARAPVASEASAETSSEGASGGPEETSKSVAAADPEPAKGTPSRPEQCSPQWKEDHADGVPGKLKVGSDKLGSRPDLHVVRKRLMDIAKWCYRRELPAHPDYRARLAVALVVDGFGCVAVEAKLESQEGEPEAEARNGIRRRLLGCLAERSASLRTGAPAEPPLRVTFELGLDPG